MFAIDLDIGHVILENGGDVDLRSGTVRSLLSSSTGRCHPMPVEYSMCVIGHATALRTGSNRWGQGGMLTSGKVPLEKTLRRSLRLASSKHDQRHAWHRGRLADKLHQQTSFPAGTITDDDEFAADLGHLDCSRRQVAAEPRF